MYAPLFDFIPRVEPDYYRIQVNGIDGTTRWFASE